MKSDDITGDLDLLGDWLDAKGYTEEAGLCTRAMDEINRLREALRPFANKELGFQKWCDDGLIVPISVELGSLRKARAAMGDDNGTV